MKCLIGDAMGFEKIGGGSILFTWNFLGLQTRLFWVCRAKMVKSSMVWLLKDQGCSFFDGERFSGA
jgi:hypothetical protein